MKTRGIHIAPLKSTHASYQTHYAVIKLLLLRVPQFNSRDSLTPETVPHVLTRGQESVKLKSGLLMADDTKDSCWNYLCAFSFGTRLQTISLLF